MKAGCYTALVTPFAGKAVELGKVHGIPTPVNETLLRIIHVLEERGGKHHPLNH